MVPVLSVSLEGISVQQITVTAGQSKSITCVTGVSRPAPRVLWYIGVTNVTSMSTETQLPKQELFYTRSTVTFIPIKSQNRLQINCKAYNTDNFIVELSTKPSLNVQCNLSTDKNVIEFKCIQRSNPPDDANAVIKQGSTISKIEGNSATLVCEVRGGNPLSTIKWDCFGLTGTSSTDGDLSRSTINFIAHRSFNRRNCTCRASHPTWCEIL
ncbi:hypothetical protein KUTeg_001105 [Tegillarca granosa]|uniref:Ig-like domain-containing protein n=1 Tax=Tegillarca granosa TaxID=220873 RepID=A0ABQ9FVW9_TEGGR|nr:hypothetical protein KUTeg_001105 [Tegillarca granosa]